MDGEEICKCDKLFATNRTLNSHIASFHEGRLSDGSKIKHSCPICSKAYASKIFMIRHIAKVHDGKILQENKNKFKCTLCESASFTQKHNLKKHIESFHEGKKAFVCNICDRRFVQKIHLKIHIKSAHEGNKIAKEKTVLNIHTSLVDPKETKDFKTEIVKENLLKMED